MNQQKQSAHASPARSRRSSAGFSLFELMVAMLIFLIVGGVAVNLVRRHEVLFTKTQNQSGLNITIRNAVAQIQSDAVNAGSGYYPGASMPFWPVGITVAPKTAACTAATGYTAACFDSLQILTADPTMPAASPTGDAAGTLPFNLPAAGGTTNLYLTYPATTTPPLTGAALTAQLKTWAAEFAPGNEVLLVTSTLNSPNMAPLVIQPQAGNAGATVTANNTLLLVVQSQIPDPLMIEDSSEVGTADFKTTTFGPPAAGSPLQDFVIRLDSTKYSVNVVNGTGQLMRQVNTANADVIANGIVGFNLTEAVPGGGPDGTTYAKLSAPGANWTTIRALQVNLVARPNPGINDDPGIAFTNGYDQGNYPVQGISVVINPRNLSMNN